MASIEVTLIDGINGDAQQLKHCCPHASERSIRPARLQ